MADIRGVLFDFGDTLFARVGAHRAICRAAAELGTEVGDEEALALWDAIQSRARTAAELARGRDLSAAAHRNCWTDLYRAADVIASGMAELLYGYEVDPAYWQPFAEVGAVLHDLRAGGIPVGVVSDTGWDIREVFDAHGLTDFVDVFVLSCEQGVAKPARVMFDEACRAIGVPAGASLMVGDNPLTDGGAVGAGLPCLVVPPPACRAQGTLDTVLRLVDCHRPGLAGRVRSVLFDWRGTLVADPDDAWWLRTAASRIGRALSDEAIGAMRDGLAAAGRLAEVANAMRHADCDPASHRSANMLAFKAAGIDEDMANALYDLDFDPVSHPLYPDAAGVLRELRERQVAVAVVSDIHFDLRPEFEQLGIAHLIDAFILSFELGMQKPDLAIFRHALAALASQPDETLMVGDNPARHGAAAALGITALLLPPEAAGRPRGLDLVTKLVS